MAADQTPSNNVFNIHRTINPSADHPSISAAHDDHHHDLDQHHNQHDPNDRPSHELSNSAPMVTFAHQPEHDNDTDNENSVSHRPKRQKSSRRKAHSHLHIKSRYHQPPHSSARPPRAPTTSIATVMVGGVAAAAAAAANTAITPAVDTASAAASPGSSSNSGITSRRDAARPVSMASDDAEPTDVVTGDNLDTDLNELVIELDAIEQRISSLLSSTQDEGRDVIAHALAAIMNTGEARIDNSRANIPHLQQRRSVNRSTRAHLSQIMGLQDR